MDIQKTAQKKQKNVDYLLEGLSEKLRLYRFQNNLTLKQMGDKARVSFPMISELENGIIGNIGLKKLVAIANSIGYTFEVNLKPVK